MNFDRFISLVGKDSFDKISNLNILIVGIGGVGGYTLESLVRSGIKNITIIDYDKIDITNLNRQIITNIDNIGLYKVDEAVKRYKSINNDININGLIIKLDSENIKDIDFNSFDYIVDACDDTSAKTLIINEAIKNNVKVISSMGTAKKMDASKLIITTLNKTNYDPLAKKMRGLIDKKVQSKVHVVTSNEQPIKIDKLASNSYVPAVAGLLITYYIINDTLKN